MARAVYSVELDGVLVLAHASPLAVRDYLARNNLKVLVKVRTLYVPRVAALHPQAISRGGVNPCGIIRKEGGDYGYSASK